MATPIITTLIHLRMRPSRARRPHGRDRILALTISGQNSDHGSTIASQRQDDAGVLAGGVFKGQQAAFTRRGGEK